MKIGIIVAMDREMLQLQQLFTDNSDVCIIKCGIGKVNAALGAQRLINEFHPQVIISTGCAGGHGEGISIQDVVVSSELCYHDVYCGDAAGGTVFGQVQGLPARFQADPVLLQKAQQLSIANSQLSIHAGLIVTGDWFVDSKDKMREIVGRFPECKAVDMESAAIAQTCLLNKVRFISFRVISDLPLVDTDASQYHDFWNTMADRSFQITKTFVESL
jgi:adenosylhomocysteine nucleosidase